MKLSINRLKIGSKFMLTSSALIILVVLLISLLVNNRIQQLTEDKVKATTRQIAQAYANVVDVQLEEALNKAKIIADLFAQLANNENVNFTRAEANKTIKNILIKNPSYIGIAVAFEPNAFDGADHSYINQLGHDETGRFIPYWSRNNQGHIALSPLIDYKQAEWYKIPQQTRQLAIIDPFLYPIQGQDVFITSLMAPILNDEQQFLGVVGIDFPLSTFVDEFSKVDIKDFSNAYVTLFSHKGLLVGSSSNGTQNEIGKDLASLSTESAYVEKILLHEPFNLEWHSSFLQETVMSFGFPIQIGQLKAYWMVSVNIPVQEIHAQANTAFLVIALIGLIGVALALVAMYILTRRLLKPLNQVNAHLGFLSQGQPLSCEDIQYQGRDEIAQLVGYAHQLKQSMVYTINQAKAIAAGDYSSEIQLLSKEDQLGLALSEMLKNLRTAVERSQAQDWLKTGQTELNNRLSGEQTVISLAENIINFLVPYLNAQVGALYLLYDADTANPYLKMVASHAYTWRKHGNHEFKIGEGLVGQAALERKAFVVSEPPEDYLYIQTGLGGSAPRSILIMPFLYDEKLKGVLEIAAITPFSNLHVELLKQVSNTLGVAFNSATSRTMMSALLEQTQLQAEEMEEQTKLLQHQQSELQQANEELQSQSEELQTQQEELRQANEELQSRTVELERQRLAVQEKNRSLETASVAIEAKAKELEQASRYKSEFLANMSHELRTPLNSLLILAQLLMRNTEGNLTEKQREYAQTIHSAGEDLLTLINEILDLSKVEAGRIEISREPCDLNELLTTTEQKFHHVAKEKGLQFTIVHESTVPEIVHTDPQRLKQIINNLLSNAFKFTEQGEICLTVAIPERDFITKKQLPNKEYILLSVRDTGIGIPTEKQAIIFEAFQQADGTTSRRYGGTGLGLAISRQLARLLGGDLYLSSAENEGSTFTLIFAAHLTSESVEATTVSTTSAMMPLASTQAAYSAAPLTLPEAKTRNPLPAAPQDDRDILHPNDKTVLIMEDDRLFANMLMELAHEKGFKCIYAADGNTGLQLVERYNPDAIVLDVGLPRIDGLTVMERIKDNPNTRHIPVHFISGSDQGRDAKRMGAIGYLLKPVSIGDLNHAFEKMTEVINQAIKHLLLVVDDPAHQQAIESIIDSSEVKRTVVPTPSAAIQQLKQQPETFDAIVLDVDVAEGKGLQLLDQLACDEVLSEVPVILHANRPLTEEEEHTLQQFEDSLTVKSVASPERLLDEVTLFMHQIANTLSEEKQQMLRMVHDKEAILAHKKVLLVDDDMRNTFALMTALEDKDMEVSIANNGLEALALLKEKPVVDIVLMDIMMPELDGYETMRAIRKQTQFRKLPIIALTAKAMKDDKAKCIEAGANDYLTKPVDVDKLLSLMRVWLYK